VFPLIEKALQPETLQLLGRVRSSTVRSKRRV
jgi:hypothetical protein